MKRFATVVLLIGCFYVPFLGFSQSNYGYSKGFTEIGMQGGYSGYRGDLGGTLGSGSEDLKSFSSRLPDLMSSINATYSLSRWLNLRPNLTFMQIAGNDKDLSNRSNKNDRNRYYRNLGFKSLIYEASVLAEINPFYILSIYREKEEHKIFPYAVTGVAVFHFNPRGNLNGIWYDLQQFSTEGQGMKEYPDRKIYSRTQISIPIGGGFKYYLTPSFYAGAELLYRQTFTDYLDDVSTTYIEPTLFDKYFDPIKASRAKQLSYRSLNVPAYPVGVDRGSPKTKDAYFSFGLRLGITIGGFE